MRAPRQPLITIAGMTPAKRVAPRASLESPPSAAQSRIIDAALRQFTLHGVGGTSLQMIASEIGVTKAALYHQYNTKEEIVRAAAAAELGRVEALLDAAEVEPTAEQAREVVIQGMVDLAVERREHARPILADPVAGRMFANDKRLQRVMARLDLLLMGPDAGPDSPVATAMLTAAISGAVMHPLVAGSHPATMRAQLLRLARRFLELPSQDVSTRSRTLSAERGGRSASATRSRRASS